MKTHLNKSYSNDPTCFSSWEEINWKQTNMAVKKLRYKIFKAKKSDNIALIHKLQGIMLSSHANILLSIRQVTSINVGKQTPGLDKMLIKSNSERWSLYLELSEMTKMEWVDLAQPVKRIYIPKADGNFRPIGIPNIKTRVIQSVVKNALEPEWEAIFESSSYGFRPGRSCHDALARIYVTTARHLKRQWVLDADIQDCFADIKHSKLLELIGDFPAKKVIKAWLKAGYCEFPNTDVHQTSTGIPQSGVISPLLANIALHGMEKVLRMKKVSTTGHNISSNSYALIRYANHFIILSRSEKECRQAKTLLNPWLKERGLEFSSAKVRIIKLDDGFKFLGCSIKLYGNKRKSLLIKPHPDTLKSLKKKLKDIWLKYKGQATIGLIRELNPVIRGWANYYSPYVSSDVFSSLDHFMWYRAWRYVKRRHPNKNNSWRMEKYFGQQEGPSKNKWRFYTTYGNSKFFLLHFSDVKIKRHVMVQNNKIPDDRSLVSKSYWEKRSANRQYQTWANYSSRLKLAKKQYHLCPMCLESLYNEEELHVHHIMAKKKGGKDFYMNLVILHTLCHRQIHTLKLSEKEVENKLYDLRMRMKKKLNIEDQEYMIS